MKPGPLKQPQGGVLNRGAEEAHAVKWNVWSRGQRGTRTLWQLYDNERSRQRSTRGRDKSAGGLEWRNVTSELTVLHLHSWGMRAAVWYSEWDGLEMLFSLWSALFIQSFIIKRFNLPMLRCCWMPVCLRWRYLAGWTVNWWGASFLSVVLHEFFYSCN